MVCLKILSCLGGSEGGHEVNDDLLQFSIDLVGDLAFGGNGLQDVLVGSLDVSQEFFLEGGDLGWVQFVQVASDTAVDDWHLLFNGHGYWNISREHKLIRVQHKKDEWNVL